MVGSNVKAEAMALMDKRSGIEAEMDAIISRLCSGGGPGVSGSLVDAQGFPRSDIDLLSVRSERRRLDVLRNDHKDITQKIDQHIQLLHSGSLSPKPTSLRGSAHVPAAPTASVMDVDAVFARPFSLVDQISEESPAAEAGLQLGDQLVKFGTVEFGHNNLLQKLAAEAQENQGRQLSVVVIRQGVPVNLTMTPRTWGGRGLLGCHFQML